MKIERIKVHNQDELRGVGCGVRTIDVKKGRKWIYYRENHYYRWCKMLKSLFERLEVEEKISNED